MDFSPFRPNLSVAKHYKVAFGPKRERLEMLAKQLDLRGPGPIKSFGIRGRIERKGKGPGEEGEEVRIHLTHERHPHEGDLLSIRRIPSRGKETTYSHRGVPDEFLPYLADGRLMLELPHGTKIEVTGLDPRFLPAYYEK